MQLHGRPFHGSFSSSDASSLNESDSRFTLYSASNTPTAITLAANERVLITDVLISAEDQLRATIFDGLDDTVDPGERVCYVLLLEGNRTFRQSYRVPHYCQRNDDTVTPRGYPKLKTSGDGQIDAIIRGMIISDVE